MSGAREAGLIALAAGGTGGHVFPAQALAATLDARGHRLALLTDARGHRYGGVLDRIESHPIRSASPSARGVAAKLGALFRLMIGTREAKRLLARLKPGAVVGFGGYASVPPVLAACRLGIPTVIHEQNAVLGRANRLLARRVDRLATSFPTTLRVPARAKGRIVCTGNPVRPPIAEVGGTPYRAPGPEDRINLLIFGGSQGARALSTLVPAALAQLPQPVRQRLQVVQQCRPEDLNEVATTYQAAGIAAECDRFFEDMAARLGAAHLVIARAGASTVAELAAAGRPSILIPYPHALDDHQSANARALEAAGAAWLMAQDRLTTEGLAAAIAGLLDAPERLAAAAAAALGFARADAARALADIVEALAKPADRSAAP
ncbi:MAG: undecaprenyldiphospho-muramoylpentapeptide beta-N-acetylglucosaminyltransferase [Alphaproteobacteria bacterium]